MSPDDGDVNRPRRGRPVDHHIDAALVAAAHAVFAELGWRGTTVERVAMRAGVSRASAYRRCESRYGLLMLMMGDIYERVPVADTGTLRGDLVALMEDVARVWRDPAHVRFLAAVVSAQHEDERLSQAYLTQFTQRRAATSVIVQRAAQRGELARPGQGDLLLDMLAGIVAQVVLLRRAPLVPDFAEQVVDALLNGFGTA